MNEEGVFVTVDPGSLVECSSEEEAKDFVRRGLGEAASGTPTIRQPARAAAPHLEFGTLAAPEQGERMDAPRQASREAIPPPPPPPHAGRK
jgi:hypothetical protein